MIYLIWLLILIIITSSFIGLCVRLCQRRVMIVQVPQLQQNQQENQQENQNIQFEV